MPGTTPSAYGSARAGDPIRVYRLPVPGAMKPSSREPDPVLVTGASGYVGAHLLPELLRRGRRVRALARRPEPGRLPAAVDVRQGDAVSGAGLAEALDGCRTAYYLIHSMGRGSGPGREFARRDREAAVNFGEAAREAGVERGVYLGGRGPTGEDAAGDPRARH